MTAIDLYIQGGYPAKAVILLKIMEIKPN